MSLIRALALAIVVSLIVPLAACEDVTVPPKPELPKQIPTLIHFTKTTDKNGQQTGLQSNDVYSLFVPSDGSLWIGNQGGVAVYGDPTKNERTEAYNETNGLPNPKVRCMAELNGILYVGTWGGGVGVFDLNARTWQPALRASTNGLVADEISSIKVHDDKLYIATVGGVSFYDPVTKTWERYMQTVDSKGKPVAGSLLDAYVSALEVADTPRGTEYWYCPRWESLIESGQESWHGITVARNDFNVTAVTVKLQASRDNTLYDSVTGDLSNGAGTKFFAGRNASNLRRRGVIAFDIAGAGIPPGAVIRSVTLRLSVVTGSAVRASLELHRALSDWGEGTSVAPGDESAGGASTTNDATWIHTFYPSSMWNQAGGDYALDASGAILVDTPKRVAYAGKAGMVADVTAWLRDPSTNHGWVVITDGEMRAYATRENPTASLRPELEIVYQQYTYYTILNSDLPAPNVNDIVYDASTDLTWLSFATQGLASVDVAGAKWTFYTQENLLPSNSVYSIAERNGILWLGTQNGLAREVSPGQFQGYDRGGGLPADRVRRVYVDDLQRLWLGFIDGGAALVNPDKAE